MAADGSPEDATEWNLAVTRCISTIIAADYLQMIRTEEYVEDAKAWLEEYLGCRP